MTKGTQTKYSTFHLSFALRGNKTLFGQKQMREGVIRITQLLYEFRALECLDFHWLAAWYAFISNLDNLPRKCLGPQKWREKNVRMQMIRVSGAWRWYKATIAHDKSVHTRCMRLFSTCDSLTIHILCCPPDVVLFPGFSVQSVKGNCHGITSLPLIRLEGLIQYKLGMSGRNESCRCKGLPDGFSELMTQNKNSSQDRGSGLSEWTK